MEVRAYYTDTGESLARMRIIHKQQLVETEATAEFIYSSLTLTSIQFVTCQVIFC